MRVVHVATLVSPDGAYGGPIRVALNITKELRSRTFDAELWAGARGYSPGRHTFAETQVRFFPARVLIPRLGFATTAARGLLTTFWRERKKLDLLHIHMGRDLVTLPMALTARIMQIPYVLQTHGMVQPKEGVLARIFDALFTRPALRGASVVYYLTLHEQQKLIELEPSIAQLQHLVNGVPTPAHARAVQDTGTPRVLFLARLHERKRPGMYVEAAVELLRKGVDARFELVGPDEGEACRVHSLIRESGFSDYISYAGPLDPAETDEYLRKSSLYVLPSIHEPFPMSVLEAMALGVPVVITDSCGLASFVRSAGAGEVVDESLSSLVSAMHRLIESPTLRSALGRNGQELVRTELNIGTVAEILVRTYPNIEC